MLWGFVDEDSKTAPQRIRSLDFLKGFAILAILAVHLFVASTQEARGDSDGSGMPVIVQALYLGLMGFFVISGYFFRPGRGFVNNVKKRLLVAGAAYLAVSAILPLILCLEMVIVGDNVPTMKDYIAALQWTIGTPELFGPYDAKLYYGNCAVSMGHYFIQAMLVSFVLFYAIADHIVTDWRKTVAVVVILIFIQFLLGTFYPYVLPFHAHMVPLATAFMLLGALAGRYQMVEKMEFGGWKTGKWIGISLASLAIGIVICYFFPPGTAFNETSFGEHGAYSIFPFFISACFILVGEVFICILLSKIPYFSSAFIYLGKHTLSLLLMQCFTVKMLLIPFYEIPTNMWFPETEIGVKLALLAASIAIPIIVSNLVVKHLKPWIKKVFGGYPEAPI